MNDRDTWDQEYTENKAIPSSHREQLSLPFQAMEPFLELDDAEMVVEVGCGNGRHTAYLARQEIDIEALDFSEGALEMARNRVEEEATGDQVTLQQQDVTDGIPHDDSTADIVIDSYVSCHFLDDRELEQYMEEVERILKPGGRLYWSGMASSDGYYGELGETHPDKNIVVDPLNNVAKRLYTHEEVQNGIPGAPAATYTIEMTFDDFIEDHLFERHVLAAVYRFDGDG
ncbi:MAG: class I SAM-dependent methyltransferase [Candidatus Nanohaloarchaea archaeon]|nr:class I SAM-dependent methyltransferase [Candidatus Nanohaloarchaea archaeon]